MQQNNNLRKSLRKQRRSLNIYQQKQAEIKVLHKIIRYPQFISSNKIGIYLHAFGEIQTQKLIEYCFKRGKLVYLPMIRNMDLKLVWVKISLHQYRTRRFTMHRLGMLEPMAHRGINVATLDCLVMPLLACDTLGTRMGMGAGFYDRTLSSTPHRPYRIGLAHDFQILNTPLQRHLWDEPLDTLITPSKVYQFTRQ